jgi:hypothetical protein
MSTRGLDPTGKGALFTTPVHAARDTLGGGEPKEGKEALYSTGRRRPGTVVVTCSTCTAQARVSLIDLGLRSGPLPAWLPGRRFGHRLRCPSCHALTWCSVAFTR